MDPRGELHDAIVVGGGHNGLVAGAYLARAGLRTVILEARDVTGGAAVTETPWGDDFKVTALSYVMSLMPPTIIRDLQLEEHGYRVEPMGPSFIAFPDGRYLLAHDEASRDVDEVAKFSTRDAARLGDYEAWLRGVADVLSPLLLRTPPRVGSHRPGDLLDQVRMAWGMRGLDVRGTAEATRLFTMSIADVLDEWFESPEVKGVLAINGVIGTWAGPEEPGTAYVMMHHTIGDVGDGHLGSWGYPIGGMGAVSAAIRRGRRVVRRRGAGPAPRWSASRCPTGGSPASSPATGASCGRRSSSPPRTPRSRSCATSTPPSCRVTSSTTCAGGDRVRAPSR